ncbi:MAG TPA: branched-chain amino acid ABC transporter permease [Burkholderiaceae bacterium]|nr:branched-chain amino acid ABC transporter permease [Burkholderiaceae bacterium]
MSSFVNVLLGGVFHAAVLFLVAAGLQIVFGVQKIINLACGAFYATGAYVGVAVAAWAIAHGLPPLWFLPVLVASGLALAVIGPPLERLLRTIYGRDEAFQLLLTFALLLVFEDALRFIWGANPQQLGNVVMQYGSLGSGEVRVPTYNVIVIVISIASAIALGAVLQRTRFGRIVRATAENRGMSEAIGVDTSRVNAMVFTLGTVLGTLGGALVVPTAAASLDMAAEVVVEAFAVVVIGGLGSMRGAIVGAMIVGLMRAAAIAIMPELEVIAIYAVVILVLILRPWGLFGKPAT